LTRSQSDGPDGVSSVCGSPFALTGWRGALPCSVSMVTSLTGGPYNGFCLNARLIRSSLMGWRNCTRSHSPSAPYHPPEVQYVRRSPSIAAYGCCPAVRLSGSEVMSDADEDAVMLRMPYSRASELYWSQPGSTRSLTLDEPR
jgi:hypothetical protein